MTTRFEGKTAVITGGGGDIGRATAVLLASEGAGVFVVDVDDAAVARTVDAVERVGGRGEGFRADVSDSSDVQSYAERAVAFGGGVVDLLFNNAGVEGRVAPIVDLEVDDLERVLGVNVRGVFLGLKHVLPVMADGGAVVNTSSVGGLRGSAGLAAYVASKHAVLGLTKTAALEVAHRGIRVTAICPGAVQGRMMTSISSQRLDTRGDDGTAKRPFGRHAQPEEVAAAVGFLLGPGATFVSGSHLVIDGAQTAR